MSAATELSAAAKQCLAEERAAEADFAVLKPRVASSLEAELGIQLVGLDGATAPPSDSASTQVASSEIAAGEPAATQTAAAPQVTTGAAQAGAVAPVSAGFAVGGAKLGLLIALSLGVGAGLGIQVDRGLRGGAASAPSVVEDQVAQALPSQTPALAPTAPTSGLAAGAPSEAAPAAPVMRGTAAPASPPVAAPPTQQAAPTPPAAVSAEPALVASDLRKERALIDAARSALAHGNIDAALDAVQRHQQAFPQGQLSVEREAIRKLALSRGEP